MIYVYMYLVAAVAANTAIAYFGPRALVVSAALFIGLNMTVRDKLHDRWQDNLLWLRMLVLILSGSVLSYIASPDAGRIGIASMVAFICSEFADAFVYGRLRSKRWSVRVNASNTVGAAVDSLVFPTIAFASWLPAVVLLQFGAKVVGGFLWSWVLKRQRLDPIEMRLRDYSQNRS